MDAALKKTGNLMELVAGAVFRSGESSQRPARPLVPLPSPRLPHETNPAPGQKGSRSVQTATAYDHRAPDHFEKFMVLSLVLHVALLVLGAMWTMGYREPELTLAQGLSSIELISIAPGQNGSATVPSQEAEAASAAKKHSTPPEKFITGKQEPVQPRVEEKLAVKESERPLEKMVPSSADAQVTRSEDKSAHDQSQEWKLSKAQARSEKTSEATPSDSTATNENGEGKSKAPALAGAPGISQPGSPGGVMASAVSNPTPPYPESARRQGMEGVVILRLMIDTIGKVRHADIVHSSGRKDFDKAAVETVERRWRYRPAMSWGHPVESQETVRVAFVLND